MSDWELIDHPKLRNSIANNAITNSDWSIYNQPKKSNIPQENPHENILSSLGQAPWRIGQDIGRSLGDKLLHLPSSISKGYSELSALPQLAQEHPGRIPANIGAGLTEAGHGLLNFPHEMGQYATNRLNILPKSISEAIPHQRDISQDINQTFGKPKYPGEEGLRTTAKHIMDILGSTQLAKNLNPMKLTSKNIAEGIVDTKKSMQNKYSNEYNNLWNEAKQSGFSDMSHIKPDIDIKTIKKYSPEKSFEAIEEFEKNPTVQNAHDAKSDLIKIQQKQNETVTKNAAERKHAKAISDAINSISENMFKDKHGEVNDYLKDKYGEIQQGYRKEVLPYTQNDSITDYQRGKLLPGGLVKQLTNPMGEFQAQRGQYHPLLKRNQAIKKAIIGAGLAGGTGTILNTIYNKLNRSNE